MHLNLQTFMNYNNHVITYNLNYSEWDENKNEAEQNKLETLLNIHKNRRVKTENCVGMKKII